MYINCTNCNSIYYLTDLRDIDFYKYQLSKEWSDLHCHVCRNNTVSEIVLLSTISISENIYAEQKKRISTLGGISVVHVGGGGVDIEYALKKDLKNAKKEFNSKMTKEKIMKNKIIKLDKLTSEQLLKVREAFDF